MAMEAELKAARNSEPYEPRHPGEVLMSAFAASDVLLSYLLQRRAAGELTVEESTALGWAIDRAARTSKTALDANVAERMVELKQQRLEWHAKDRAEQMWGILVATVKAAPLSAQDRLLVWNSLGAGVRAIQDEREPAHLAGDELHGVTARLELEAREEAAAAEVIVWDDSDFDSDDVGSPLSLVSTHGDGAAL